MDIKSLADLKGLPNRKTFCKEDSENRLFLVTSGRGYRNSIILYGSRPSGKKVTIEVTGIYPYFDMRLNSYKEAYEATQNYYEDIYKIVEVPQYPLHGFQLQKNSYYRVYFKDIYSRMKCLMTLSNIQLAHDDRTYDYLEAFFRDNKINSAGYNILSKDITEYTICSPCDIKPYNGPYISDQCLIESWDIETSWTSEGHGIMKPGDPYEITTISLVYAWSNNPGPIVTYVLSLYNGPNSINFNGNEALLLIARSYISSLMKPDIRIAFNGSNFDWAMYLDRIKKYNLWNLIKEHFHLLTSSPEKVFKEVRIKIDAETNYTCKFVAMIPGTLDLDLQPIMYKKYPKQGIHAQSLNTYLKMAQLDLKNEISFKEMETIFQKSRAGINTWDLIGKINEYCRVDSIRPIQLLFKNNILVDKRELATMTYTSLFNSFYRADGNRVLNLLASYSDKFQLAIPMKEIGSPGTDFPGAWVAVPKLGLYKRPVSALDFNSLYPSVMITFNISPEMLIQNDQYEYYRDLGYSLHKVSPFEYRKNVNSPKEICPGGYFIRHRGALETVDKKLDREYLGILGYTVRFLLEARREVKKLMKPYEEIIQKGNVVTNDIQQQYSYYNAKQLGYKILANTFYGQTGSSFSPISSIVVAAGITQTGRSNIEFVRNYVESLGCSIVYGDTDSVYITCPENIYTEAEQAEEMIHIARQYITNVRDNIAKKLLEINGIGQMKMELEEVGLPSAFFGRKKYILQPHAQGISWNAPIMIRGLEPIRRGTASIIQGIEMQCIKNILIPGQGDIMSCVSSGIRDLKEKINAANFHDIIKTMTYREDKKNISINLFVSRMKKRIEILLSMGLSELCPLFNIQNGDKISYIIMKQKPDPYGRNVHMKIGECMELPEIFKLPPDIMEKVLSYDNLCPEIDRDYYIQGSLAFFARLLNGTITVTKELSDFSTYLEYDKFRIRESMNYIQNNFIEKTAFGHKDIKMEANIQGISEHTLVLLKHINDGPILDTLHNQISHLRLVKVSDILNVQKNYDPEYFMKIDINSEIDKIKEIKKLVISAYEANDIRNLDKSITEWINIKAIIDTKSLMRSIYSPI